MGENRGIQYTGLMAVTRDLTNIWFWLGIGFSRVSTRWYSPPTLSRRMPFIVSAVIWVGDLSFFLRRSAVHKTLNIYRLRGRYNKSVLLHPLKET